VKFIFYISWSLFLFSGSLFSHSLLPAYAQTQLTPAEPDTATPQTDEETSVSQTKPHQIVAGLMGGLVAGRLISWSLNKKVKTKYYLINEGWFQRDTYSGGADKWGHFYTDFVFTRLIYHVYRNADYSQQDAIRLAFLEDTIFRTLLELSDGYTAFGASLGDILFNVMGSSFAALLLSHPEWDDFVTFSWSYVPSTDVLEGHHGEKEFSIDYTGMVFSLDFHGWKWANRFQSETVSRFLELSTFGINYRSRHYKQPDKSRRQRIVGVSWGVNYAAYVPKSQIVWRDLARVLRIPGTYSGVSYNLDKKIWEMDLGLNYFY
jgi:hypothetical protein